MGRSELKKMLSVECDNLSLNGIDLNNEWLKEVILAKVYRTAVVIKNTRESDKGGIKATLMQAVSLGIIDNGQAFELLVSGNKIAIDMIKGKLPKNEKTEEPTEEDIDLALKKVIAGNGQNDF